MQGRELVPKTSIQLLIDGSNLDAFPGCNELTGTLVSTPTTTHLTDWRITEKGCYPDPESFIAQENWFEQWLQAGVNWSSSDGQLALSGGGVTASFTHQ